MPNASDLQIIAKGYQASPNADVEAYADGDIKTSSSIIKRLLAGTGTDQVAVVWVEDTDDTGTAELGISATRSVDLQTEVDARGTAIGLSDVIFLMITHKAASTASGLTVNANGANGFTNLLATTGALKIPPGSSRIFYDPVALALAVSGANKVLDIVNDDGSNTAAYRIEVWGR